MTLRRRDEGQDPWMQAALALGALLLALLCFDTMVWHQGFALGDETDVISRVQRIREGAPWEFSQGGLHRSLLLGAMSLWPGRLWATSVPALAAFALEGFLLFALGRRLAGSRAGFFAVLAGLASAFSLVRARSALSFALFPVECLFVLWLRFRCSKPWQWALWGALLGLLSFEYEAFIPVAALLLLLPFPAPVPLRQRAWELGGLGLVLLASFDPTHLMQYFVRRKTASLAQAGAPSAGLGGLKGLLWGDTAMPYLEPLAHGIFPLGLCLMVCAGLGAWTSELWVPLAYLGMGAALPLMGGAPYGLPAHRAVAAWPVVALLAGLGLERLWSLADKRGIQALLALALFSYAAIEVKVWAANQAAMDARYRGPVRDLQRAAIAGCAESQRTGFPLVTELHPMQGAQFRFLTGQKLPVPDAGAPTVIAFIHWQYLPAVRHNYGPLATFQEQAGQAPCYLAVLTGPLAAQALEAERSFRPLLIPVTQYTVASTQVVLEWLRRSPKAGPWARTLAVDYLLNTGWYLGCLDLTWVQDAQRERLVSAHPLLVAAQALELVDPAKALAAARQGTALDPHIAAFWPLERRLLLALGRGKEIDALNKGLAPLEEQQLLFIE